MSLSAQDIVALARAGFSAEQIGAINAEAAAAPTVSTEPTLSTEPTVSTDLSTEPAAPVQESPAAPAEPAEKQAAAAQDPGPTVQDLMAKLVSMENRLQNAAIQTDQQPGQQHTLTGEDVLARILDPTIK